MPPPCCVLPSWQPTCFPPAAPRSKLCQEATRLLCILPGADKCWMWDAHASFPTTEPHGLIFPWPAVIRELMRNDRYPSFPRTAILRRAPRKPHVSIRKIRTQAVLSGHVTAQESTAPKQRGGLLSLIPQTTCGLTASRPEGPASFLDE